MSKIKIGHVSTLERGNDHESTSLKGRIGKDWQSHPFCSSETLPFIDEMLASKKNSISNKYV